MRIFLLVFATLFAVSLWGQSDGCSTATLIGVTADCSSPTAGTTIGATQTIAACTGTADDDVWYQFVATATSHQIIVDGIPGMDPVVQLFSGGCGTLISLVCKDNTGSGGSETINYSGLNIGNTYRIRVYDYFVGSGTGDFTICITTPPPAPLNDDCANAIGLSVNGSCTYTMGTTDGASESNIGCSGFADDDVWYSFVATNSLQTINVSPIDNLDLVYQLYSGTCGALNSIACVDNTFTSQAEQQDVVGLVPGQTYYIRVYDYYSGTTGDFEICITGTPTAVPTNDEPCNAIQLPEVTASCQYAQFTTVGASASLSAPTPASCVGGGGAAIGGFSASSADVWFAITVPASGTIDVTPQPNGAGGSISDGVMALYTGTCSSLTQIICSDDNNYPGSSNDLLPMISESGLTPGSTVYLRYWGFGTSTGTFGLCVTTATNDDCANALYICDINGYSSSTSASYTPDRPDNMRGNNEDINGVNMPDGTNTGGIFGQGGPWGTGAPFFDVNIDNNSWIKFTASNTTATLGVSIYDCWVGNYPSGGIQMQIFEGNNCMNFVPVSNFEESSTGFTITAINLTIGNDYYLMVDGYAGDICGYTITANSGVQFPDIADVSPICVGQSVNLTAPSGANSYEWQHNGATSQSVNVTPSTTETYYCEVTGLCDFKQILDVTVTVNPNPTITIVNGPSTEICAGSSVSLTASGGSTYLWNTLEGTSTINVSPSNNTTYDVIGYDANGCSNTDVISVAVNNLPTIGVSPTSNDSDCGGSNGSLTGAAGSGTPTLIYSWSDGTSTVGSSANLINMPAGTYTLTITDGNSCSDIFGPYSIGNPGAPAAPAVSVNDDTPCLNSSIQLDASNVTPGVTYNWSGPNGYTGSGTSINLNNVTSNESGNYCVSSTLAGCTGPSTCQLITVLADPTISVGALNNDTLICVNQDAEIQASGASTYVWNGPNGFNSTANPASVSNMQVLDAGYYIVTGTDINGCSSSDSIFLNVANLPSPNLVTNESNNTFCGGGLATISASGGETYTWSGPGAIIPDDSVLVLSNLNSSNEGYYVVTATDSNGCSAMDSIYLSVITFVFAEVPNDTTICPGEVLILEGGGGVSYTWAGPGGYSSNQQNPVVTTNAGFENSGEYTLTIVDTNGCLGYNSTMVDVSNNSDCLFIPNLITPDRDGNNELWIITGIDTYKDAEVEIYNRWGNLVYAASPYLNDWDGSVNQGTTIDGKDGIVPVGTYFYIIRLNEEDKPPFKGYIEVQY